MLNKPGFGNYDKSAQQIFKLELEISPLLFSVNLIFQLSLSLVPLPSRPLHTP
jgi:hypothetical protein